ncbi:MAG: sigma-70 family RNA polymerase sigma factor [Gammaproteobacteria bacterium]|nr:MAG: sigma-70 family RNA polymerase sigma factor [Gammaproteobacteria bacterium]
MSAGNYIEPVRERQLIAAAHRGDVVARNELISACLPYVRRAVAALAPAASTDQLDDLLHESVLALYDALEAYALEHPSRPRLYVFAATRIRKAVALYFRAYGSASLDPADFPEAEDTCTPGPDSAAETAETISLVRSGLSGLGPLETQVLYSRLALDPPPPRAALARQFGCSQQWIERVERRAAENLADLLSRRPVLPAAS